MNVVKRALTSTARLASTSRSHPFSSSSTLAVSAVPVSPSPSDLSSPLPARGTRLYSPSTEAIGFALDALLGPLGCGLEQDVGVTCVTSKGWFVKGDGSAGHNGTMSFVGRRVLRMHLALFLSQSLAATPTLLSSHLTQPAMDRYLETKQLGASVGRAWELESIMRWREVRGLDGEPSGLYKTRGAVLEAIVGGVYLRHGINCTSRLFRSSVLPHLSLPRALSEAVDAAGTAARAESP